MLVHIQKYWTEANMLFVVISDGVTIIVLIFLAQVRMLVWYCSSFYHPCVSLGTFLVCILCFVEILSCVFQFVHYLLFVAGVDPLFHLISSVFCPCWCVSCELRIVSSIINFEIVCPLLAMVCWLFNFLLSSRFCLCVCFFVGYCRWCTITVYYCLSSRVLFSMQELYMSLQR